MKIILGFVPKVLIKLSACAHTTWLIYLYLYTGTHSSQLVDKRGARDCFFLNFNPNTYPSGFLVIQLKLVC